ncbi:OPA3-like protein [Escovopsis weberi]|uniref:OPA3-like protein n=1 Tax=Escovopsis weberi TaxID=150374 RepID=A0A0M8N6H4_ESCWE|nr:OPA3-like protein [Escovopsis weberi]
MVALPVFKLASLFLKHISKYGANRIKAQAHDHPRFRALAARYGQAIHQLNMRMQVTLLRDPELERRAKERAEAPTVKTEEQTKRDDEAKAKAKAGGTPISQAVSTSVWRRKFRSLPEAKAVDLFADVAGDTFILGVATALIVWEYWRSSQKPDANLQRIEELKQRIEELQKKDAERQEAEERQRQRFDSLEGTLRTLRDPKTKQPLLPLLQNTS